jgi:hypothetical protein
MFENTERLLTDWGKWQRSGNPISQLGYKSPGALIMRGNVGGGVSLPPIDDEFALMVDRAISQLRSRSVRMSDVVFLRYAENRSIRDISVRLKLRPHEVRECHASAVAWLDRAILNIEGESE